MKVSKLLTILLCVVYAYTNQLGVHAFAMHGDAMQGRGAVLSQDDCGHDATHTTHNHDEKSTMDCLSQGKNVLSSSYSSTFDINHIAYISSATLVFLTPETYTEQYYFSLHDPGRGEQGSFAKFLDDLYGKGVIMLN